MTKPAPTDRELEALKVLWQRGDATVREVYEAMNENGADVAYTTVSSLLQVMEDKAIVSHRVEGKAFIYSAKVDRSSTMRRLASGFLDKVFDGAMEDYIVHALESRKLEAAELDRLAKMIKDTKRQPKPKRKKGSG